MNNYIEKFELYIVSLWLLFLLIIIITIDVPVCLGTECEFVGVAELVRRNVFPLVSFVILCFGIFFYIRFNYRLRGSKKISEKISKIENLNYEHLTFLTTYIIPLICFNLTSGRYVFALFFLLVVIGVIYVKTDMFYANPTLAVLGYRLYRVDFESRVGKKESVVVITKNPLFEGSLVRPLYLDENVCFGELVSGNK